MEQDFAVQLFENKQVRVVWDAEKGKYFFSVSDIVQVLTDSTDVKQYIKRMRSRDPELNLRWGTICTPTRMKASDGKTYQTQSADLEGIFRIIQSIPSPKAEPLKRWLAEVGAQRIATTEISRQRNPKGFDESRQTAQAGGRIAKNARKDLEQELGHSVVSPAKASDYLAPVEDAEVMELPKEAGD